MIVHCQEQQKKKSVKGGGGGYTSGSFGRPGKESSILPWGPPAFKRGKEKVPLTATLCGWKSSLLQE